MQLAVAQVQRPLACRQALGEHEIAVDEVHGACCQGFEAAYVVVVAGGYQSPVVEAEHTACGPLGQFEIAGVVELADELNDRGQADADE